MIIKLDKLDIEMCQKLAAESDYSCTVYTMESNRDTVQVQILWGDGRDLSPTMAYHFGRMLQMYTEDRMQEKVNAMMKRMSLK